MTVEDGADTSTLLADLHGIQYTLTMLRAQVEGIAPPAALDEATSIMDGRTTTADVPTLAAGLAEAPAA